MRRRLRREGLVLLSIAGCATVEPATATAPSQSVSLASSRPQPEALARSGPQGWIALSAVDAPQGREDHTAIWTGSEMIVWGGEIRGSGITPLNSGARYDPAADRWTPMTDVGAPDSRDDHAVVWTGAEMIVWGGNQADEDAEILASGGRYDPVTDEWTPTAPGPLSPRDDPTAVWTGKEMIIWGGSTFGRRHEGSGARYDPVANRWSPLSSSGAPQAREDHTAVWTGTEMIVWGGWSGDDDRRHHFRDGARYDPVTDEWAPMSSRGAPEPREDHTAVWTGTEMLVWGGVVHRSKEERAKAKRARKAEPRAATVTEMETPPELDPADEGELERTMAADDTGAPMVTKPVDETRKKRQLATGGLYDPATDTWRPMSLRDAPTPREDHVAVWMGRELLVWGGRNGKDSLADGAIYDPSTDSWRPLSPSELEPVARWNHTAVFAEDQVILWGGFSDGYAPDGGRYRP